MSKTAFLFPGQGAQYVGMAREFYEEYEESRRMFALASQAAGFSIEDICFTENEKINETQYTQPSLLTACCAILSAVKKEGIRADAAAGLSLGEYCALTAAGSFSFSDAVHTVCRRGVYMQTAVPEGEGCMCAVLSRKPLPVEEICAEINGVVSLANDNCPGQQVITGEKEAVREASERLLAAGAARVVPLKVSGPFHSPMLAGAGQKLADVLENVDIREPELLFVSNVTAEAVSGVQMLRRLLAQQVYSPVRWQQSMRYLIGAGVDTFIEIGPGKTLSNFMKKIDGSVKMYHIETPAELRAVQAELG
ncbi:[acyl-carrier-protein] S-malonyltransferase [Marvinbryantia formatexigens DSM 14469]|uniref:Malonyl CoA-acyl carrier protein transacylase n=1 Tax=Marvinbryantia formatexigens DSM 14469 TaxID=478749 RepID=C6L8T2_9FIRM|nr:ACP S-malonyltransferase [Marvinbryantia formatexigens]EET62671.1 [acyl-carrier-protein] S-malonyltransferase [Marvinbryantia formatexigens DSM 14469]UWO23049.1 ACP S-malonyltransferase [Marvinbryantia formatexigens DSM 14469]SDF97138.1 [acyl-carrier-protein] S-malonyltransferase [Marvinbryantia formatexigens]